MPRIGPARAVSGPTSGPPSVGKVRITAREPFIDIELPMGDGPAMLTSGFGGWVFIERQDDISLTDWSGQDPLTQDVPILLNGYGLSSSPTAPPALAGYRPEVVSGGPLPDRSVEEELRTIFRLGRDVRGDEHRPPVFRLDGPVFFPEKAWVLPANGIELLPESVIRNSEGALLRQALVLHCLEYVRPDVIRSRRRKKKRKQSQRGNPAKSGGTATPGYSYTTKKGDTLVSIAKNLYGNWQMWDEIGRKNDIRDAHRKLPAGIELKLPKS